MSVMRILRLRSASEISIAGLVGFKFLLDSVCMNIADVTEAPAARDVDGEASLVTSEGRWGGNLGWKPGCRAGKRLWCGYVMPLALQVVSGVKEADSESQLNKQLLYYVTADVG
jgi:hypothetical protein